MRNTLGLTAVAVLALALTACSASDEQPNRASTTPPQSTSTAATSNSSAHHGASPSSSAAEGAAITIKDFAYQVSGPVAPGQTIELDNEDGEAHTVTAKKMTGGAALFGVTVPGAGMSKLVAPTQPGSYEFICTFHGNMHGTLIVR